MHNNESKPKQALRFSCSQDRSGRYGQTVFNEMMAYINMPLSLFLLSLLLKLAFQ